MVAGSVTSTTSLLALSTASAVAAAAPASASQIATLAPLLAPLGDGAADAARSTRDEPVRTNRSGSLIPFPPQSRNPPGNPGRNKVF
jgi:hypothetical protein